MDFKTGIGKTGVALAIFIAIAMCLLSYLFHPIDIIPVQYGICLPSPDSWDFPPFWSWIINTVIIGIITLLISLANRSYNFVRTTEPILPVLFLIMASSCPWFTQALNISVLLCLANVVCMAIIFGTYQKPQATQELFILGVVAGVGSMFQYAFLPLGGLYLLWALFMKVLSLKTLLAFLGGIACPYWISLGIGWIDFSDFHFPSIIPLFAVEKDHSDFLLLLAGIGVAAAIGFVVSLVNSIKLYAGNSRVNAMNLCISTLGAGSVLFILVDYDNMPAYVISLYLACAVQVANINALWNPRIPWITTLSPSLIFIALFVGSIIL